MDIMNTLQALLQALQAIEINLGSKSINFNLLFIVAIIGLIQLFKEIILKKKQINPDIWKVVAFLSGFFITLLQFGIDNVFANFDIYLYFASSLIYGGVATIIYQTGKLGIITFTPKEEEQGK